MLHNQLFDFELTSELVSSGSKPRQAGTTLRLTTGFRSREARRLQPLSHKVSRLADSMFPAPRSTVTIHEPH